MRSIAWFYESECMNRINGPEPTIMDYDDDDDYDEQIFFFLLYFPVGQITRNSFNSSSSSLVRYLDVLSLTNKKKCNTTTTTTTILADIDDDKKWMDHKPWTAEVNERMYTIIRSKSYMTSSITHAILVSWSWNYVIMTWFAHG